MTLVKGQSKERKESGKVEERVSQGDTAGKPKFSQFFHNSIADLLHLN